MKAFCILILFLAVLSLAASVDASPVPAVEETEWQCDNAMPTINTNWGPKIGNIIQFDNSLGILTKVEMNSTLNGETFVGFEHLNSSSGAYANTSRYWETTTVLPVGLGSALKVSFENDTSHWVTAYDGKNDFCCIPGGSGFNYTTYIENSTIRTYTNPSELSMFTDGVPRTYSTSAKGWAYVIGSGNYNFSVQTKAGSQICFKFYYIPTYCISGYKLDNCTGEALPGWNITITNSSYTSSVLTDSNGKYEFCGLWSDDYTLTEEL